MSLSLKNDCTSLRSLEAKFSTIQPALSAFCAEKSALAAAAGVFHFAEACATGASLIGGA